MLCKEIRKIIFNYAYLSGGMKMMTCVKCSDDMTNSVNFDLAAPLFTRFDKPYLSDHI